MTNPSTDKRIFDDLERKLSVLINSTLQVGITGIDRDLEALSGGILKFPNGETIEIQLDGLIRTKDIYGIGIVGRTKTHYLGIGTHNPHGYISRITRVAKDQRDVLYENLEHYHFAERNWGFIFIPIKDYRESMELPVEAEDPKNPVLGIYPHQ